MALADPLVTTEELGAYMRTTFTGPAEAQADLILRVISAWARTVGSRAWTDMTVPDDVIGVILSASRRELTNPDRIITEQMGPLSVTRAKPPEGFFTAAELTILRRKAGGGLHTVSTRREDEAWGTGYLHMREDLSDEPFPYLNYGEPGWEDTIHY